jgi:hypothetical protein
MGLRSIGVLLTVLAVGCGSGGGGSAGRDAAGDASDSQPASDGSAAAETRADAPADARAEAPAEAGADAAADLPATDAPAADVPAADAPAPDVPTADAPADADGPAAADAPTAVEAGSDAVTAACPGPLVGSYDFEATAGPVTDSSGCAHDGVASAAVVRGVAGAGNAAGFGAPGSYVAVDGIDDTLLDGDFTFEAWVRRDAGQGGAILSLASGGGPEGFYVWADANGHVTASAGAGTCATVVDWGTTTATLAAGGWSHVAVDMLRGSSPGLRYFHFYVDGTFVLSSVGVQQSLCHDAADRLYIGALGPGTSLPFSGRIDEVKIWSVSRSRDEVCADVGGVYGSACDVSAVRPQ